MSNSTDKPRARMRLGFRSDRWISRIQPILWLAPILALSLVVAYLARFDGTIPAEFRSQLLAVLPLVLVVKSAAFIATGLTLSCHAFISLHDCYRLLRATLVASAGVAAVSALFLPQLSIPRGVILIDACLTAIAVGGVLTLRRSRRERRQGKRPSDRIPVLLAGGPNGVELVLRALRLSAEDTHYMPLGILSDSPKIQHRAIAGVPVIGQLDDVASHASHLGAEMILISGGDLPGDQVRSVMSQGRDAGIEVRVVPAVSKIVSGHIDFKPREVAIEDLLGRPTVDMESQELSQWIAGKRVLVTGSAGSIGSELVRQLLKLNPEQVILVDRSENGQFFLGRELQAAIDTGRARMVIADVTEPARVNALFREAQPQVVFHAAAYKHVPLMEENPGEGVKNIIGATKTLVDLAHASNVETFVMISTDKAVNPTNVMGCCKRVAEIYAQSMSAKSRCRFVTVRFGNVLGSAGSVIPVFRQQIASGGPVTVTDPRMTRFFMTIPEASRLVLQAAAMGQGGEIFVLDMGSPVRIIDLAEDMIRLSGLRVGDDIEIRISGLRPGEKLYEELYSDEETQGQTRHPKILKANCVEVPFAQINRSVSHILDTANGRPRAIYDELREIVPSFKPDMDRVVQLHGEEEVSIAKPAAANRAA